MKFSCFAFAVSLLLNLQLVKSQNETLTNNLISALFQFVEGNHEEMSAEMMEQLHAVQQGLESQANAIDNIADEIDEIEDLALGGSQRCAGVIVSGHCVILHNQRYNIHTANQTCFEKGQILAKIFYKHEYSTIIDYVRSSDVITDRSLVYVWTSMDLEGFARPDEEEESEMGRPPRNDDHHMHYLPAWLPSYPRRNPNFRFVAWQIVSNPMFADSGFMNVPAEATAYPLCAYELDDEPEGPEPPTNGTTTQRPSSTRPPRPTPTRPEPPTNGTTTQRPTTTRRPTTTSEPSTGPVSTTSTVVPTTVPQRCGEELSGSFGVVQSPNFPQNYDDNHNCEWQITVPEGETMELAFIRFDVEQHASCSYDYVEIYDGPNRNRDRLLGRFCGFNLPPRLYPTQQTVTIVFVSDGTSTGLGWLLSWSTDNDQGTTVVPSTSRPVTGPSNNTECGQSSLTGESGTIQSPNFPENYNNDHDCQWQIMVPQGEVVYVSFATFDVEYHSQCNWDFVEVFDGPVGPTNSLGKFCGTDIPPLLSSSGNLMTISFVSDGSTTQAGWILAWTVTPPPTTTIPVTTTTPVPGTTTTSGPTTTLEPRQCGNRQPRRIKRASEFIELVGPNVKIVGGTDAERGDWPWQIGYAVIRGSSFGVVCGGTLISTKWAITAAHCTVGAPLDGTGSRVILGAHELGSDGDKDTRKDFIVSELINHQQYDDSTYENDITLLKLAGEAVYTAYIQPACLPTQGVQIPVGTNCWITGWGETQAADTDVMQQASVPIVDNADCQSWSGLRILDNMVCAGFKEGGIDSCQGDSGGPLVCTAGNSFVLQGVTSHGIGCAEPNKPGVYTRMSEFVSWTEQQMSAPSTDTALFNIPMTACGSVISSEQVIRLPVNEETQVYADGLTCGWTIQPPTGSVSTTISFIGERFHIESNGANTCYDYLEVIKTGQRIKLFCGATLPADTVISGEEPFTLQFVSDVSVGFEGFAATVLFNSEGPTTVTQPPPPGTTTPVPGTTTTGGPTTTLEPRQCGNRQPRKVKRSLVELLVEPDAKIVGGTDAERGDWPWQIAYGVISGNSFSIVCGGTLISTKWAITAAHCTVGAPLDGTDSRVILGAHELNSEADKDTRKDFFVSELINHQQYDDDILENDITLLKLAGEVVYTAYIQPACLPTQGVQIPVGTNCWITGWGETQAAYTDVMQQASVPIVDNADCQSWSGLTILDNMVCAGFQEGGIDSCQGDSGGPLVCTAGNSFVLQGVTSRGIGCAEPNRPGVYTRMSEFVSWTEQQMSAPSTDTTLFNIPMTACGSVISSDQVIRLPVDEETQVYADAFTCSWIIEPTSATTTISFTGERFHIEANAGGTSCYDYLEVARDGQRIHLVCGATLPNDLVVSGQDPFTLKFDSDASIGFEGFAAMISFN